MTISLSLQTCMGNVDVGLLTLLSFMFCIKINIFMKLKLLICFYLLLMILFQVVLNLLDLEEGTLEHPQEGQFFICNLNTSQIVLHNNCVKLSQSPFFKVLQYQLS